MAGRRPSAAGLLGLPELLEYIGEPARPGRSGEAALRAMAEAFAKELCEVGVLELGPAAPEGLRRPPGPPAPACSKLLP